MSARFSGPEVALPTPTPTLPVTHITCHLCVGLSKAGRRYGHSPTTTGSDRPTSSVTSLRSQQTEGTVQTWDAGGVTPHRCSFQNSRCLCPNKGAKHPEEQDGITVL